MTALAPNLSAGFVHNGQIVYSLEYWLETTPPVSRSLIVDLTPSGDAAQPWILPAEPGRRIVTTKPGDCIRFRGELQRVTAVNVYRGSQLPQ